MQKKGLPTVKIKGKDYTLVKDRVLAFNDEYPNGSIVSEMITPYDSQRIIMRATVTPDVDKPERKFVDYSQAVIGDGMINTTAALENASTSAVGRALAMMGIGVIESIASVDEINKATSSTGIKPKQAAAPANLYVACANPACKNKANTTYGKYCWACDKAFKGGATFAAPKKAVPDTEDGQPFPDFLDPKKKP